MRSTTLVKKLGKVSPALLWNTASHPETLRVRLHPRPRLSAQEAVVALFPDATPAQVEAFGQKLNESHEFFDAFSRRFVSERRWRPIWEPWG